MRTFSDDAICCAVLCISTAVLDFFFFLPANSAMLDFYVPYIGISHFLAFWALSLAGSTGAMMALRAVPVVGPSLQWLAWALLTVPLRAYWLESHGWKWLEQALVPFLIFSTDHWTLEHLRRPADVPGTLSQMNIFPTLCSILCRDLEREPGRYGSLVSDRAWERPELLYIGRGTPWNGDVFTPELVDADGRIILPTELYIY